MSAINEHDRVVITIDVVGEKLAAGDVGTVVPSIALDSPSQHFANDAPIWRAKRASISTSRRVRRISPRSQSPNNCCDHVASSLTSITTSDGIYVSKLQPIDHVIYDQETALDAGVPDIFAFNAPRSYAG